MASIPSTPDLRFLDPRVFGKLQSLELIAKFIVEGFMIGLHRSPYHGFSVEFSSYRKYSPGDNLKFVDWKLYGRTDRHYVKQFEENTNLTAWLVVDRSASMALEHEGVSKLRYGCCLSAALAYLMLKQRDTVGLAAFDRSGVRMLHPSAKSIQLRQVFQTLQGMQPGEGTDFSGGLEAVATHVTHRGMLILISDLLADPDEILQALRYFRYKKHEVIVFQVLSPLELDFPYREQFEFVDAETGQKLVTSGGLIRQEYLEALNAHIARVRQGCVDLEVDFVALSTAEPVTEALVAYLSRRAQFL